MAKVVRKVANAALLDNGLIRVSNVRLSYPHLDRPYKKEDDKGVAKYGVVALLPKDTHKAAKKLIEDVIADVLKEAKVKALAADKKFLRDGDESDKEEHAECWTFLLAKSAGRFSSNWTMASFLSSSRKTPRKPSTAAVGRQSWCGRGSRTTNTASGLTPA
jgi:hypothetical protein